MHGIVRLNQELKTIHIHNYTVLAFPMKIESGVKLKIYLMFRSP